MSENDELCQLLRKHVHNSEQNEEYLAISLEAINSFERICQKNEISANNLDAILFSLKSPALGPYYVGMELLLTMLCEFPFLNDIFRELSKSKSARERWIAISAIRDERISLDIAQELSKKILNDRSSKNRTYAVEGIFIRCLHSLIPDLKQRLLIEKNQEVKDSLEWVISRMEY